MRRAQRERGGFKSLKSGVGSRGACVAPGT
jgi:hypothetical protein